MQNKNSLKYYLQISLIFILLFSLMNFQAEAKKKKKKKRRVYAVNIVIKKTAEMEFKKINDGLIYKNLHLGNGKSFFNVHIAEISLNSDSVSIFVHKMGNNFNTLESLPLFINNFNQEHSDSIYASVNANFWKAYSSSPIGPTVVDGLVVEIQQHKNWSSMLIDTNGIPFINNYNISGTINFKNLVYSIDYVNRRRDSLGICFYNTFGGDTIPYITNGKISIAIDSAYKEWKRELDQMEDDSTEQVFDTTAFIDSYKSSTREKLIEQVTLKALVKNIDKPLINSPFRVIVKKISKGKMELPKGYSIISFGSDILFDKLPSLGDTLQVIFQTNYDQNNVFQDGISGTPRIARKGIASQEAKIEGNNARRFINAQLPRTMIGYNSSKTKFYLITVEGTNRAANQFGASLNDLAKIAKSLKLFDAMNLDGGGSSSFVLNGKNLMRKYSPLSSRKLSVIFGVKKKIIN